MNDTYSTIIFVITILGVGTCSFMLGRLYEMDYWIRFNKKFLKEWKKTIEINDELIKKFKEVTQEYQEGI